MDEFYRLNALPCSDDVVRVVNVSAAPAGATSTELHRQPVVDNNYFQVAASEPEATGSDMSDQLVKTQIASHPLYPNLVSAYIECQKVIQLYHCYYYLIFVF